MLPIYEPLTQIQEAKLNEDIASLKSQVSNIQKTIKPSENVAINKSISDVISKTDKIGTKLYLVSNANYTNVGSPFNIPFSLPEGTWLVTANGAWDCVNRQNANTNVILVTIHPDTPGKPNTEGYNPEAAIEVAGNTANYIRFNLSLSIINTKTRTSYLNIFLGNGGKLFNVFIIGVKLK